MQHMNLLGTHANHTDLRLFAKALFDAIGVKDYDERESGNYVAGYYMKGSLDGITFIIAISDEDAHEDLPYWIHISANLSDSDVLIETVAQLMRSEALPAGFHVAHMVNFGKQGEQRIDY